MADLDSNHLKAMSLDFLTVLPQNWLSAVRIDKTEFLNLAV